MLKNPRPGITPEEDGKRGPVKFIEELQAPSGHLVAYVGDVVGTGSSRKSATNSVLWFTGEDIPFVPNKRFGGVCLGGKIAPIFYNTHGRRRRAADRARRVARWRWATWSSCAPTKARR